MRTRLDMQLNELHERLIEMCSFVEQSLRYCKVALLNKDKELAKDVIKRDKVTDEMEKNIEYLSTNIIIRQQPVASDLRRVTAALKIITDLERIGDQTEDISEIILTMTDNPYKIQLLLLSEMFDRVGEMLKEAIDSFIVENVELANHVRKSDDEVDELFLRIREKCIEAIKEKSEDASQVIDLIQIAKYLERIGDHAENIAEWVIYTDTGSHKLTK